LDDTFDLGLLKTFTQNNGLRSVYNSTACFAKHANDKAAKWAKAKRPRKSRPSDINRKKTNYELLTLVKPAEYTIDSAPPVLRTKPEVTTSSES
jgi:Family of unknown function (DUF5323)